MIVTKADYRRFLLSEQSTAGSTNFLKLYLLTCFKPTHRFLLLLRTCEYLKNVKRDPFSKGLYAIVKYLKYRQGLLLNFSIPENVAGEGLQLPHYGTIVINPNAKLGKYCRLHVCVNVGAAGGSKRAPQIGDYVYVGPGAKIYGDIVIANKIAIAPNAAVSVSFFREGMLIGGVPAKEIKPIDIHNIIKLHDEGID